MRRAPPATATSTRSRAPRPSPPAGTPSTGVAPARTSTAGRPLSPTRTSASTWPRTKEAPVPELKFHPFNSANFWLDRSIITAGVGCGERLKITVTWSVIRHPEGIVVVDTGLNAGVVSDAAAAWGTGEERLGVPEFPADRVLTKQLEKIGIAPGDVKYVVMT